MPEVMSGNPVRFKHRGRKPKFDEDIKSVAGKPKKFLHVTDWNEKETIRQRAKLLGFHIETFANENGGWNLVIS